MDKNDPSFLSLNGVFASLTQHEVPKMPMQPITIHAKVSKSFCPWILDQMMHTCMENLVLNNLVNYAEGACNESISVGQATTGIKFAKLRTGKVVKVACKGKMQKYLLRFNILILPVRSRIRILQMKQINLQWKDFKSFVVTTQYHWCIPITTIEGCTYSSSEVCEKW